MLENGASADEAKFDAADHIRSAEAKQDKGTGPILA